MFFGKGGGVAEEIEESRLDEELDRQFDKKLEKFAVRTSKMQGEIARAKGEFILACEEFERLSVEPDIEYVRLGNPNYIKEQKRAYAITVKRTLGRSPAAAGPTIYSGASAALADLDSAIAEIGRTNETFKPIVRAYPRHLGRFKSASMSLDSLASDLRLELQHVERELGEYNDTKERIYKLHATADEAKATEEELALLQVPHQQKDRHGEIKEVEGMLSLKRGQIEETGRSISKISSDIDSALVPLEKAARIYDHFSGRKRKLADVLSEPLETLETKEGLAELHVMLDELAESVRAGRLELKNPEATLANIARAKNGNLSEKALKLRQLHGERHALDGEVQHLRRRLEELDTEIMSSEAKARKMEELSRRTEGLSATLKKEREEVEGLFLKYYKRRVTIR